jgi:hypothetical protein
MVIISRVVRTLRINSSVSSGDEKLQLQQKTKAAQSALCVQTFGGVVAHPGNRRWFLLVQSRVKLYDLKKHLFSSERKKQQIL